MLTGCGAGTVEVALPRPAPAGSVTEACARLVNYLPARLDGHGSRVVSPRSPLVHAWGSPPIVMRCGVPRPPGFSRSSPLATTVDGVLWFQRPGPNLVRWTAVRREANVELAVPTSYDAQGGFLVELSSPIKQTIR